MSENPVPLGQALQREVSPSHRKSYVTACWIDVIAAVLWMFLGVLAQANSPTGKGAPVEGFVGLALFLGAPALGWWLYNATRVEMRWILVVVWAPIVLVAIGLPIAIAYA